MNPALPLSNSNFNEMNKWYFVYMLESNKNGKIYIGCTSDVNKRMKEHQEGKSYFTKHLLPIELIYYEAYLSKRDAFEREKKLKHHGSAVRSLKLRIKNTLKKGRAG